MKGRPIFVVGSQRSGTTLLQALIGAHPNIAAPPETHFVSRIADLSDYYGDLRNDANLVRALRDLLHPPIDVFKQCGFDEKRLLDRLEQSDRSYPSLLKVVLDDFAERNGKKRWSEKSPGHRAGRVWQLFPDAQVIHIIRDPRNAVASRLRQPYNTRSAVDLAAEWRAFAIANIRAGASAGPDKFFHLRYEDLACDPVAALRVIFAFLEEEPFEDALSSDVRQRTSSATVMAPWQEGALQPVRPAQDHRPERLLARVHRAQVEAVVEDLFEPLGYRPPSKRARLLAPLVRTLLSSTRRARRLRPAPVPMGPSERHSKQLRAMEANAQLIERWRQSSGR